MNVVKCKNGHFFDGDSYAVCPHCGEGVGVSAPAAAPATEKKRFGWGHKNDKSAKEAVPTPVQPPIPQPTPQGNTFDHPVKTGGPGPVPGSAWGTPTDVLEQQGAPLAADGKKDDRGRTLNFWQMPSSPLPMQTDPEELPEADPGSEAGLEPNKAPAAPVPQAVAETEPAEKAHAPEPAPSLRDAVKNASASSGGKTMSYFSTASAGMAREETPTAPVDPVVGWLVCVGGKHFGESFVIAAGKNSIGRSEDNRIVLNKDNQVSRAKHALITYEPRKRNFYLQPGDSSGLTYLNDEYIEESKKLAARDVIEFGSSKFIFVPLCGETFSWEEYMPKEQ